MQGVVHLALNMPQHNFKLLQSCSAPYVRARLKILNRLLLKELCS